jgi:hypothetical protein
MRLLLASCGLRRSRRVKVTLRVNLEPEYLFCRCRRTFVRLGSDSSPHS